MHGGQRPAWRDSARAVSPSRGPQPASCPCAGPRRASEVGVAFVRLLPASSPPGHGAPHAGKSASSLGWPEKSVPTPLRAPLRPQALKPIKGARPRGAGAPFRCPDVRLAGEDVYARPPAWAPAQGARLLCQGEVRVSHPNRDP